MWGALAARLAGAGVERRRRAYGLLALAVVLFGTAWPTMKLGLEGGATPMWFAAARAVLGAAASFSALLVLGSLRRPGREDLPIILSIGLLQVAGFFVLSNLGLQLVPAGRSVVLAYTTSLWLVPLAALSGEQVSMHRLAGVVVGLGGVAVLLSPFAFDWTRTDVLVGHVCLLLAALAWALAIFHARRHGWGRLTPMQALPWQMLLGAAVLTGLACLIDPAGRIAPSAQSLLSLLYVGLLAAPLANWAATEVSRALPTLVSSIGFLGAPVLGVALSTLWLGEPLTPALIAGGSLVLVGLVLVVTSDRRRS